VFFLTEDLANASRGIKDRVADVMVASGPTFVRTMKRLVPKDTRTLEKSLHFTVARREPRLRLGSLKRNINPKTRRLAQTYAGYVHEGTSRVPSRPFVSQAIDLHTTDQGRFMRGMRAAGVANIGRSTGGLTGRVREVF
jgi:hypothetical protein